MFDSSMVEVAIGVIFIYLLLSLIITAINEFIASCVNKRGNNLLDGIKNLLDDKDFKGLAQQLYTHGRVQSISKEAMNSNKSNLLPSYMSSNIFAGTLLDILASRGVAEQAADIIDQKQVKVDAARARLITANGKLAAQPNDAGFQKLVKDAQAGLDKALYILQMAQQVKQAHADADNAAKDVKNPKDLKMIQVASAKLGNALDIGRKLAAELPDPLGTIQKAVEALPQGYAKESLLTLIYKTKRETVMIEHQIECLQSNIEQWFNEAMDRVSGWYKRWSQKVLLVIAIILVIVSNADTLTLAKRFACDGALRASVVTVAEKAVLNPAGNPSDDIKAKQDILKEADTLGLPLGWAPRENDPGKSDQVPHCCLGWLLKLVGLFMTICAVSLGAPFWFDTLSKFVNIRGAGTPPGESRKSAPQSAKS
ncbi:MAG: hypothetical protein ACLPN1_05300 [Dissulfurispiraceae bacterium]